MLRLIEKIIGGVLGAVHCVINVNIAMKPFMTAGRTAPSLNPLILYHTLDISLCWSYQQVVARGIDWLVVFASCWDFSECPLGIPAPSTVSRRGKGFESGTASSRPSQPSEPAVRLRGSRPQSSGGCGRPSSLFERCGRSSSLFRILRAAH